MAPKNAAPKKARASRASYWLIKSEPSVYAFSQLQQDGTTRWDGVRNFEARNNLRAMQRDDLCLFYHSNEGKEIVGVARVAKTAFADPTADEGDWSAVEVASAFPLAEPVTLATIKATKSLATMQLVTKSRISVVPVTKAEWDAILKLGKTKSPIPRAQRE